MADGWYLVHLICMPMKKVCGDCPAYKLQTVRILPWNECQPIRALNVNYMDIGQRNIIQTKCQNRIVDVMVQFVIGSQTAKMADSNNPNDFNPSNSMDVVNYIITKFNSLHGSIGHTYPACTTINCLLFSIFYFTEREKFLQIRQSRNE